MWSSTCCLHALHGVGARTDWEWTHYKRGSSRLAARKSGRGSPGYARDTLVSHACVSAAPARHGQEQATGPQTFLFVRCHIRKSGPNDEYWSIGQPPDAVTTIIMPGIILSTTDVLNGLCGVCERRRCWNSHQTPIKSRCGSTTVIGLDHIWASTCELQRSNSHRKTNPSCTSPSCSHARRYCQNLLQAWTPRIVAKIIHSDTSQPLWRLCRDCCFGAS
jgi:hypothetical protein